MQKLRLMHHTPKVTKVTFPIYLGLFFLALHYYLIVYINANFLRTFMGETALSWVYIVGSISSIGSLLYGPKILKKIGCVRLAIYATIAEIIALVSLSVAIDFETVAAAFILQHVANPLILFCLDIFLESMTRNSQSGRMRGVYLTILNTPAILGALLSGIILINAEYYKVYMTSAIFILPLLYILYRHFRNFKDPRYREINISKALTNFDHNHSLRDIFVDTTLLHFFYGLVTIYLPIYLYQVIGMPLEKIGLIFAIALLPFILFQIPIGRLADRKYGEKEFLIAGFILMSFATIAISFINSSSILLWTLVLLLTRIGAAVVEIATESYFFKQVSKNDADIIGLFRMAHPIAFIFMPLLGIAALFWINVQWMFFFFGILILFLGLRYAFDLRDTR